MTPGDVFTKLRYCESGLRLCNSYKLELIWEWNSNISLRKTNKKNMYLHNANEIILFDTFHDVWVQMFAIVKLRGNWGEKNSVVITGS